MLNLPIAYFSFSTWGLRPQTPGIFRFTPKAWLKDKAMLPGASPMPLDLYGARVASQQSSILRKGVWILTVTCGLGKN